jgi:hypothetical protein
MALACLKRRFHSGDVGFEVFEAETKLIVTESLGTPAKLVTLQLLNDEPKSFDLGLRFGEVGTLGCQRPHNLLQRLYIVRQSGKIDVHAREAK